MSVTRPPVTLGAIHQDPVRMSSIPSDADSIPSTPPSSTNEGETSEVEENETGQRTKKRGNVMSSEKETEVSSITDQAAGGQMLKCRTCKQIKSLSDFDGNLLSSKLPTSQPPNLPT